MPSPADRRLAALALLFCVSGVAFLGVEVVWARMLARLLGSTAYAVAGVLAAVLAGLGAGAWAADRLRARRERPLAAYAVAELLAAGASLLITFFLARAAPLAALPGGDVVLLALVALACAPAGATFPLVVAALPRDERLGPRVLTLYGWNAAGGAAGALAAGLLGVPAAGEWMTAAAGAAAQAGAGMGAALLFRRAGVTGAGGAMPAPGATPLAGEAEPAGLAPPWPSSAGGLASFLFFSGFAVFYWETFLTRLLTVVVGATVFAFAIVSSAVVLGIGAGSLAARGPIAARFGSRHGGWLLPLVAAGILVAGYGLVPWLPAAYLRGVRLLGIAPLAWGALGAGALAFLPGFLLGGLFPWMMVRRADLAGRLYAVNAAGCIAGAFLAGPIGATLLRLEDGYRLGVAALPALALLGASLTPRERPAARAASRGALPRLLLAAFAGAGTFVVLRSIVLPADWDPRRLLAGVYQWPRENMEKLSFEESCRSREMLAVKRGREVIVSVEADREVNTVYVRGNGKVEGSVPLAAGKASLADLPTQVLLGKLAVDLLHGESGRRALLIGLGSGVTLGALLEGAESVFAAGGIDVIEIEPAYLDAIRDPAVRPFVAPFLPETILAAGAAPSRAPGAAPCSFHFGDARRLLAGELGERRWRVIVSQPSEPWIPGAAALFTVEFFEQAAARLDGDGGLFLQWLQMARVDAAGLELLVRTFRRAFGSVFVLRPPRTGELILVGANGAVHLERLLEAPAGRFFAAAGLEVLADRLAVFLAGPRGVEEWVDLEPGGPVNTDGRSEALYRLAVVHQAGRDPLEENLARLRLLAARDPVARYLPEPLRHDARLLRLLAARNRILGDAEEADAILRGLRED